MSRGQMTPSKSRSKKVTWFCRAVFSSPDLNPVPGAGEGPSLGRVIVFFSIVKDKASFLYLSYVIVRSYRYWVMSCLDVITVAGDVSVGCRL